LLPSIPFSSKRTCLKYLKKYGASIRLIKQITQPIFWRMVRKNEQVARSIFI
jgi:hypothetical protein